MSERDIEKGFFTAEDFVGVELSDSLMNRVTHSDGTRMANRANVLLRDWLKEQPEVFGDARDEDGVYVCQEWDVLRHKGDTHVARLVGVKEIVT